MRSAIVLPLLIIASVSPAFAAPGDLDPTFNTTGVVVTPVAMGQAQASAVVRQLDGKLVAAGFASNGTDLDFALVRYDTAGALDASFGGTGKVTTAIGPADDEAHALIQQTDGKLVAAGFSYDASFDSSTISLVRYLDDGTPDPMFGGGTGKVTTAIGSEYDGAMAIIQQTDGKLVVAGYSGTDIALVRYQTNGNLDTSFNGTGKVTTPVGAGSQATAFALLQQAGDQKLVIAGSADITGLQDFDVVLARYGTGGTLDPMFNGTGIVTTSIGTAKAEARALIQQAADGKLVVAGVSSNATDTDFTVVRYGLDGTPDSMFGTMGVVVTPIGSGDDQAYALAQQDDGKLVVAGSSKGTNLDIALVRYDATGTPDAGFGTSGIVTTPVGTGSDEAMGVVIQPDGGIVVAGYSASGARSFVAARYLSLTGTTLPTTTTTSTSTTNATTTSTSTTQPPPTTSTTTTTQPNATTSTLVTSTTQPAAPTTTTLPDPCTLVVAGATFDSLECRLGDVQAGVTALGSTKPAPTAASRLAQAIELEKSARTTCRGGDAKRTGKLLKSAGRKLGKARGLLASKKGRKLSGSTALVGAIDGIRNDMRSLKSALQCPAAAAATAFTSES